MATFNQEKTLVGAFSVIVKTLRRIVYSSTFHDVKCVCCPGDGGDDGPAGDEHGGAAGVLPAAGGVAQGGELQDRGEGGLGPPGQSGQVLR